MQMTQRSRQELLCDLKRTIAASRRTANAAVNVLAPLCEEVTRRQLPVRIDCETAFEDGHERCWKTLVVADIPVAEWEDHFELESNAPCASQLSSSFPFAESVARALGIEEACVDPTDCLDKQR